MSQITILIAYVLGGLALGRGRLITGSNNAQTLERLGLAIGVGAAAWHLWSLLPTVAGAAPTSLSLGAVFSLLSLEIALIALIVSLTRRYRGVAAILLVVAGIVATGMLMGDGTANNRPLTMPLRVHAVSSLLAYSLLAVGAIFAISAIAQDGRLRAAKTGGLVGLLPSLTEMERLVFAVGVAGFIGLSVSIATGIVFVENLFAQHLVHKTVLSVVAFGLFGVLLAGRALAGWRGRPALSLYLGGFAALILAYFGSRFVLEVILSRQWG
ncbi:MAG: cytochrome c biogenesis protein CcsA [Pseudomonadota bacterium]